MKRSVWMLAIIGALCIAGTVAAAPQPQSPAPPATPVKLIFVHHSTGGNWLADPNPDQPHGGLGRALMDNNYFVSATNYGWGPDGIGDRTDIPNWPEWFLGPNRDTILRALYNESEQNVGDFGAWSRLSADPGGENAIIMFKSCFPNSNLEGRPNDPPLAEPNDWEYSVANAKAIYNALLGYFSTRQDKLFVVITAPPLMRGETTAGNAANARAFNTWLVDEWLADYPYANVAVFDYYNVLTDPGNHHHWNGSETEHVTGAGNDFSAYPSGDSHPSTEGHTKATAEFVPLLNVYYRRWQESGPVAPPPEEPTAEPTEPPLDDEPTPEAPTEPPSELPDGLIDDFEAGLDYYTDHSDAKLTIEADTASPHGGATAMRVTYDLAPNGYAVVGRSYDPPLDWSAADGITLWLRGDPDGQSLLIHLFAGEPGAPAPYEIALNIPPEETGWQPYTFAFESFYRAAWADASDPARVDTTRIIGYGLSFEAPTDGERRLWVDDIALVTGDAPVATESPPEPAETESPPEPEPEDGNGGGGMCGSAALALPALGLALASRRRRRAR